MNRSGLTALLAAAAIVATGVTLTLSSTHVLAQPHAASTHAKAPPSQIPQGPDIEQFMRIRVPGAVSLTADGTMYVRDWPDGVYQIYRVEPEDGRLPVAGPGATMTRLTSFKDGASSYSVSPDGSRILLQAAEGGNENDQIFQILPGEISASDAGKDVSALVKPILTKPKVVHSLNTWLHNADGFVYTAKDQSPEDFYIYTWVFSGPTAGTSTRVLGEKGNWGCGDVTQDASRMLVGQYRSASDASIYELDVATGKLNDLTPKVANDPTNPGGTVSIEVVGYLPGEKAIL